MEYLVFVILKYKYLAHFFKRVVRDDQFSLLFISKVVKRAMFARLDYFHTFSARLSYYSLYYLITYTHERHFRDPRRCRGSRKCRYMSIAATNGTPMLTTPNTAQGKTTPRRRHGRHTERSGPMFGRYFSPNLRFGRTSVSAERKLGSLRTSVSGLTVERVR